MKIQLTKKESVAYFHNALCNGLQHIKCHGLIVVFEDHDYIKAKRSLHYPCYEDVLIQILIDGNKLTLKDIEGSEDDATITITQVYERVKTTPLAHLLDMINETDDAITADVIIQSVFLNSVIYG